MACSGVSYIWAGTASAYLTAFRWRFEKKPVMKTPSAYLRCLFVCLILLLQNSHKASADEFRGLWVDAFGSGFFNTSEVTKLVNDCRTYNFNAVVVQMRRRGDAFYIPQAPNGDPKTTAIASGFDALQELINQCHASNPRIEVHCWVVANLVWSDTTKAPTQAGHIFNVHPEYLTKSSGNNTLFSEGYFLDPGHPDAMLWNYNMAKDIVSRYDIDGFHWDYIRYPQQDAGFNDTAIARYNAEFGLTGVPSFSNAQFSTWRRRQVTDFLRWTDADLLEIKPSLQISAAVFSSRSDATSFRFQDWATWTSEGIIDILMPMDYSADNSVVFNPRVDDAFTHQGVRTAYIGLGNYLNTKENTVVQLNYVRSKPLNGAVSFSYRTPNSGTVNQAATFQYIKDNFQPTWEPTPALPWLANPTKAIIKGTVRRSDNSDAIYNATVSLKGTASRTQKTEPHGKYALFEVTPGTYSVSAGSSGFNSSTNSVTVAAGGIYTVDLSIALPAILDNTAPVISNVRASSITSNSCVITWTTTEASDSTVEFGTTTTYGSTATSATRVTAHSVTLTSLTPGTDYHFIVRSSDAAGNEAVSSDADLTTSPAQSDLIVDNVNATVTGTWSTSTSATDKFATDYRFKGKGTGAASLQFTPNFQVGGNYQVFEWHTAGSNRATNVPVVVTSFAGTQTYFVNQQSSGGKWNYVGTYYFGAGTNGNVKVTDGFADSASGRVATADAIRFTYLPDQDVSDLIIDNNAATVTGTWSTQSTSTDKFGSDYRFKSRGTNTAFLTYTPTILLAGDYQVFEWHPAGSNRAQNAPHIVNHSLGSQTVSVNQQNNGGKWNLVGTFGFNEGTAGNVRITDGFATPTNGVVMADAIKLVYIPPPAPPTPPASITATPISTTEIAVSWGSVSGSVNYVVGRSEVAGGPYTDVATIANTNIFRDNGLTPNTSYFYVVRAVGAGGPSNNSNEASATTLAPIPNPPSGVTATAVSASQIDLSWNDGESQDSVYIISRSSSASGPFVDIATQEVRFTSYSDTGLDAQTTYYYQVRTRNSGGDSAASNLASATTQAALPAAPSNLAAIALGANQVYLTWSDNASNEDSFTVFRSPANGTYSEIASVGADSTSYNDSGVSGHTTYFYVVRAVNAAGINDSAAVQVTTPNSTPVANAGNDQSVSADSACQASVVLDGSASSDADQDTLSYTWTGAFGTATGAQPSVSLPLGVQVVTLTVTDGQGGSSSDTVTITVVDTTAPSLTLNGSSTVTVECHGGFSDPGFAATDACAGDLTSVVTVTGAVDPNSPGVYTLAYTVVDPSGNSATATRVVQVVDTTVPTLVLNGDAIVTVEAGSAFVDPGAIATDECAGNLSGLINVAGTVNTSVVGTNVLTYTVSDPSGNSSTATRIVRVVDTTAPVVAGLSGSQSIISFVNHKMVPITIAGSANDTTDTGVDIRIIKIESNEPVNGLGDGDTGPDWEITGALTCNLRAERSGLGTGRIYTITVQFSDDSGNSALQTVTVTVPRDSGEVASKK